MAREGYDDVVFYTGLEVEKTCAFAKKTLFVVGYVRTPIVVKMAKKQGVKHVHLAARRTFVKNSSWDTQLRQLIAEGYHVTLAFPTHEYDYIRENIAADVLASRKFIPLMYVAIPNIEFNENLCIRVDDIGFNETNVGVWTWPAAHLMDSNRLTEWKEYGNDTIVLLYCNLKQKKYSTKKNSTTGINEEVTDEDNDDMEDDTAQGEQQVEVVEVQAKKTPVQTLSKPQPVVKEMVKEAVKETVVETNKEVKKENSIEKRLNTSKLKPKVEKNETTVTELKDEL